jgi:hypothetical protein
MMVADNSSSSKYDDIKERLIELYNMLFDMFSKLADTHLEFADGLGYQQIYAYHKKKTKFKGIPVNMIFEGIYGDRPKFGFFLDNDLEPMILALSRKYADNGLVFDTSGFGKGFMNSIGINSMSVKNAHKHVKDLEHRYGIDKKRPRDPVEYFVDNAKRISTAPAVNLQTNITQMPFQFMPFPGFYSLPNLSSVFSNYAKQLENNHTKYIWNS